MKRTVADGKYHSVIQGFKTIHQEEGLAALWKGHVSAQALSVFYGIVQVCNLFYNEGQSNAGYLYQTLKCL